MFQLYANNGMNGLAFVYHRSINRLRIRRTNLPQTEKIIVTSEPAERQDASRLAPIHVSQANS
jgi:hypothetical protein